jgi:hypothetical protein
LFYVGLIFLTLIRSSVEGSHPVGMAILDLTEAAVFYESASSLERVSEETISGAAG